MAGRDILRFLGTYAVVVLADLILNKALGWPQANHDHIFAFAMFCTTLSAIREVRHG